jgi:DNA repair exonuclease SbcCD ATPase subunit
MRIAAVTVQGVAGWPTLELDSIGPGLTAVYGPANTGKSTVVDLLGHALFGKVAAPTPFPIHRLAPPGQVVAENVGNRFRMRRFHDGSGTPRLTVASLNDAPVDHGTVRALTGGLSPTVLAPLCAVSFRQSPNIAALLSAEFADGLRQLSGHDCPTAGPRLAELLARRDLLAQELETRIAGERRLSSDIETQLRELHRQARSGQEQWTALETRLRTVETALAETDARLRYRRMELNVELRWDSAESEESDASTAELDAQIDRCRANLADLSERESVVRARLVQIQAAKGSAAATAGDQQRWLAVARHLAADLTGEVARLARASASSACVCHDAHPRLRPIAETLDRQLGVLQSVFDGQRGAERAAAFEAEIDHLARCQHEMRGHLEHLLDSRQAATQVPTLHSHGHGHSLSAADAEQLESRRRELEQERFDLAERLRVHGDVLKELRRRRDAADRERAALLSARSIEHVQRELASVQQKIETTSADGNYATVAALTADSPARASDYLAQLTSGELCRLALVDNGRRARVVNRHGESIAVEALPDAARDQVYLSLCLALLSAAARHGVWLPLVLDEPFERIEGHAMAALAAVLEAFCRQGHQVLIFTRHQPAAERLASIGAVVHDICQLRRNESVPKTQPAKVVGPIPLAEPLPRAPKIRKVKRPKSGDRPRIDATTRKSRKSDATTSDQSDAA